MVEHSKLFNDIRQALYDSFPLRADALFNLLDSLSGRRSAGSVAELSLESPFERQYSSLYDAVDCFFIASDEDRMPDERNKKALERIKILLPALPEPVKRPFRLTGIDATPALRPYAERMPDRGIQYYPNPAPGNKPVGVGHSYSVLALLPEREACDPPWVIPVSCVRIPTDKTANRVAAAQMTALLNDSDLPFKGELTVNTADSGYSKAYYLSPVGEFDNHVEVARVAKNRKFYRIAPSKDPHPGHGGHPRWFGDVFDLKDESTWGVPDEESETEWKRKSGQQFTVQLQRWDNLLMRGKRDAPMHRHPFDLIRCQVLDGEGKAVFRNTLWLIVLGKRRREVSSLHAYEVYRQRYDMEHFFRFGKNKLLLGHNQTPELEHEENWWELVCLAYAQLWLAMPLSQTLPRPWERYLPAWKERHIPGPAQVQRDYERIIRQFGTPARAPKPRGNSPGRRKGVSPVERPRQPIIFKSRAPPEVAV